MCKAVYRRLIAQVEKRYYPGRKEPYRRRYAQRHEYGYEKRLPYTCLYAFRLARAYVLTGVCCKRCLEGVAGEVQVHLYALPHRERSGHSLAEVVYSSLYEAQSEGYYNELQGYRQTHSHGSLDDPAVPFVIAEPEAEHRELLRHIDIRRYEGYELRYIRSYRSTRNAPFQHRHEKQVKTYVQHRGYQQEVKRRGAVAHGAEYRGEYIIPELEYQSYRIPAEIRHREVEYAFVNVQKMRIRGACREYPQQC